MDEEERKKIMEEVISELEKLWNEELQEKRKELGYGVLGIDIKKGERGEDGENRVDDE